MYAKIQITGLIEVKTGMHIGGSSAFAAIGAVDAPVIKDVQTYNPMIPGSSLKGKLRSLLAKRKNENIVDKPDDDCEEITRLLGSAKKNAIKPSRLYISDMFLQNKDELRKKGLQTMTEIKFENSISRTTAVANPRQIERVVRGSKFNLDIIYEVEKSMDINEITEDFENIADGFKLLQYDYLGGSGSRGYGKVQFEDLLAEVVFGEVDEEIVNKCNKILKTV